MATDTRGTVGWAPAGQGSFPPKSQWISWRTGMREVAFIGAAALLYSLVRGLTDDRVVAAFDNAERLITLERRLGIFIEADLQRAALQIDPMLGVVNAIYISYWPIVFGTLAWLLLRHPRVYPLYRNALLASGALSLAVFALYPLAPPRFVPEHGFVDTIARESQGYRSFNASVLVNEYAAMPSLHFGWVLLLGVAVASLARSRLVLATAVAAPILMLVAIVLTGNHYFLDGVVGGVVVLAGLRIALGLRRRYGSRTRAGLY
jgi:membrane-associated phospholipid phosphatase